MMEVSLSQAAENLAAPESPWLRYFEEKGLPRTSFRDVPNPMLDWPRTGWSSWGSRDPELVMHLGVTCKGIHCRGPTDKVLDFRGTRFSCLDCGNVDFCIRCVTSPQNMHDPTHAIMKFQVEYRNPDNKQKECKACHNLKIDFKPQKLPIGKGAYREYETKVDLFEHVAREQSCRHCSTLWRAFLLCPPPAGWPPLKDSVTIRVRKITADGHHFSIVRDHGKVTSEVNDEEHETEIYGHPLSETIVASFLNLSLMMYRIR